MKQKDGTTTFIGLTIELLKLLAEELDFRYYLVNLTTAKESVLNIYENSQALKKKISHHILVNPSYTIKAQIPILFRYDIVGSTTGFGIRNGSWIGMVGSLLRKVVFNLNSSIYFFIFL